jgi:ATP/maltotriose-dependent transcriptional regulator MalT
MKESQEQQAVTSILIDRSTFPPQVGFEDLVMDEDEVRLVLDQHGVNATEATVRAVLEQTGGWAYGVRLAAAALAELSRSMQSAVRGAYRHPAGWHDDRNDLDATIELGMTDGLVNRRREDSGMYEALFVVPLTARETDVLKLLAEFCSNEEIAAALVLSMNTVKTHMRSLFQKLSVTRRADAVRRGQALGLC